MKKKLLFIIIILVIIVLAVTLSFLNKENDQQNVENSVEFGEQIQEDQNYGYEIKVNVNRFENEEFSDQIHQMIETEWTTYENMTDEERLLSSHFFGLCDEKFDTWEECEEFVGIETRNPLEEAADLIIGDAGTGLPVDEEIIYDFAYPERRHCEVSCYGTREGDIDFVKMSSGYFQDEMRITLTATRYGETIETCDVNVLSSKSSKFANKEVEMSNGNKAIVVVDGSANYSSTDVYFAENDILYKIRVVGDSTRTDDVQAKAEELLELFN